MLAALSSPVSLYVVSANMWKMRDLGRTTPTDFGSSLSVQILICVTIGLEVDRSSDTRSNKGLAT